MISKQVLGLVGMPGSGKSIAVRVAREKKYDVLVMGDVVREETRRRGLKPNPRNIGRVMLELRQKEGAAVISRRCLPKIKKMKQDKLIIDGIRSLREVEEFKKHFPEFTLTAIHSSPETRFERLYHRQRADDPKNWQSFRKRDMRELGVGLGNAMAMADYMIVNEEGLESFRAKVRKILKRIEEGWTK